MLGTVRMINSVSGMVAVETEDGDYTIFQLMGEYDVEIDDEIMGELDTPGDEAFKNLTKSVMIDVFVAECNVGRDAAKSRVA
jgi:hypothetical protein